MGMHQKGCRELHAQFLLLGIILFFTLSMLFLVVSASCGLAFCGKHDGLFYIIFASHAYIPRGSATLLMHGLWISASGCIQSSIRSECLCTLKHFLYCANLLEGILFRYMMWSRYYSRRTFTMFTIACSWGLCGQQDCCYQCSCEMEAEFGLKVSEEYELSSCVDIVIKECYCWFLESICLQAKTYTLCES